MSDPLTPRRRDAVLVVLALALLAAPLWVPTLHLADPTYRYESIAVETNGTEMALASDPEKYGVGISDRVVCASGEGSRSCIFERYAANNTVPTGIYSGNPDSLLRDYGHRRYQFVLLGGTVYETVYRANESVTDEYGTRRDVGLEPVEATRALSFVAVDADEVTPPVREAARTGVAHGHVEDVPDTPVRLGEDAYRRVYVANVTYPPDYNEGTESLLRFGGPLVGLGLLAWLRTRVDVSVAVRYTGD